MRVRATVAAVGLAVGGVFSSVSAQVHRVPVGAGATPVALAGDYRALGWNPAGLTFHPLFPNMKGTAGGLEGGFSVESDVFNRQDLWDDALNRGAGDSSWTGLNAREWASRLASDRIRCDAELLTASAYRRTKRWGFAYSGRQQITGDFQLGGVAAQLLVAGGAASVFDQVILASGDTVANNQEWSLEEVSGMLGGFASGPAPLLSALLDGTHVGFSWVRVHEVGISRMWGSREGWTLHTGVGGRLMLGSGYFSIDVDGDQMDAFGAFSNGFGVASLAELTDSSGTWEGLRKWGPVGQGWAVDAGAVLAREDGLWFSASLTDIGAMEWRGERYTIAGIDIPDWEAGIENPTSIEGIVGEALQPGTWFGEAVRETRRVDLPTAFHAGAGKWFGTAAMLAADASLANGQALATETLRFGATALLRIGGRLFVDVGLRKVSESVFRIPAGIVIAAPEGGWQAGIRAGDIQALWKGSQPEVGMQMCFIRWAW